MIILNSKQREVRKAVVTKLNAINGNLDFPVTAQQVVDAFTGVSPAVWMFIDNAVGNAHNIGLNEPHLVRQVRNHPHWGPKLSAALKGA